MPYFNNNLQNHHDMCDQYVFFFQLLTVDMIMNSGRLRKPPKWTRWLYCGLPTQRGTVIWLWALMTPWRISWLLWTEMRLRFLLPPCMPLLVLWKMFLSLMEALRTLLYQVGCLPLCSLHNFKLFVFMLIHLLTWLVLSTGLIDLAIARNTLIGGDDFKSGQTKMKSVLVDFLVGAGIKVH